MSMSIGNKGFIAFLFLLILAVSFITWLSYNNNRKFQEAVTSVDHSKEVLIATEHLMSSFNDVQLFTHNFIFTKQSVHVQFLDSAIARARSRLDSLRVLIAGNPEQSQLTDSLAFYIAQRIRFSRMVIEYSMKGDTVAALSAVSSGRGIGLSGKLAGVIEEIRNIEQVVLQRRQKISAETARQFNIVFRITLAVILGMTGITVAISVYNSKLEVRIQAQVKQLACLNEDLQRRERRFKGLVENGFEAISLLDKEMKPIYRSPAAERITGWSNDERTQVTGIERAHPDDLSRLRSIVNDVLGNPGKVVEASMRTQHKDGHYIWLEGIMKNMLHDDAIRGIVANFRDVTERKQIETQRALYESIIQYSEDAIISKSTTGTVITWNRAAEVLFGYRADEIIGKSFAIFTPEDLLDEELAIISKVQSGIPVENFETERLTRSGKRIHVSLTASPLYDNEGKMVGTSQIARDITERKVAEEKIHRLNIELEQKVLIRTNELAHANKELKAVLHYIAHGVHQPLDEIEKHVFFIQHQFSANDAEIEESVDAIAVGANEALRVINELIQFSEITQRVVSKVYVDMNELMQHVHSELAPDVRSGVVVNCNNLHPVIADPELIKKLFGRILEILDRSHKESERLSVKITSQLVSDYVVYYIDYPRLVIDNSLFNFSNGSDSFSLKTLDRSFVSLLIIRHIISKHGGLLQSEVSNGMVSRISISIPINNNFNRN
jgi:PAS domain S-box-containing protein